MGKVSIEECEKTNSVNCSEGTDIHANLVLCDYFGGVCAEGCEMFYWHRFNITLCPTEGHLCCTPDHISESVDDTPTVQEENTSIDEPDSPMADEPASSMPHPDHLQEQCGFTSPIHRRKRVVGGSIANRNAWPWIVALRSVLGAHTCSGAVIASRWILTAAHCFRHFPQAEYWRVRTGEYDLLEYEDSERDITVSDIFIFPEYTANDPTFNRENQTLYNRYAHDLALMKLNEDSGVVPICLSGRTQAERVGGEDASGFSMASIEAKGDCWVAGWGTTLNHTDDQVLRQVHADVVDHEECSQMWNTSLQEDMICFGDGVRGPCAGDSGGPLACKMDGRFYVTGIVSWGAENCNMNGHPSVFARVISHMDWIETTVADRS
ncbi:hypothetical protein LOTGIDRAFT_153888 [Lottia gigantea]|uniref:Peptidase S1 domain-containing protein n=1 Tax=Lottia gigantea TaxID=225164 RepID=V4ADQ3_LOTGI|nr:hypothetical protein LOTGIDRAFT_153888 [Lottia gigantea]ESO91446.1 hypothetical protein LOTGIDRAFT_153888 [Lottia gigantea]